MLASGVFLICAVRNAVGQQANSGQGAGPPTSRLDHRLLVGIGCGWAISADLQERRRRKIRTAFWLPARAAQQRPAARSLHPL